MADVTIPAASAKPWADYARRVAEQSTAEHAQWLRQVADLLDPKPLTLRDACLIQIPPLFDEETAVDVVLEVVRQRIEALRRPAQLTTLDGAIDHILTELADGAA